jgi:hypothetical protein
VAAAHAVRVAVRAFVDPRTARNMATGPMPTHVLDVLKLAAREPGKLEQWSQELGIPPERLVDIAVFFIEQVMMPQEANCYRVLGVSPDAEPSLLRHHYRWLMHVLHPDKPTAGWHFVMAERVNQAYAVLRDPVRRAEYDRRLGVGAGRHADPFAEDDDTPRRDTAATDRFVRPSEGAWEPEPTLPPEPEPPPPPEHERSYPSLQDPRPEPPRPAPPRAEPAPAPPPPPTATPIPTRVAQPPPEPPVAFRMPPRPPEPAAEPRSVRVPLAIAAGVILVVALVVIVGRMPGKEPQPQVASVPVEPAASAAPAASEPPPETPAPEASAPTDEPALPPTREAEPAPLVVQQSTAPPQTAAPSTTPPAAQTSEPAVSTAAVTPPAARPTPTPARAESAPTSAAQAPRTVVADTPAETAPSPVPPPSVAPEARALAQRVGAAYAAGDFLTVLNLASSGGQLAPPDLAATAQEVQRWGRERGGEALSVTGSSVLPALEEGRIERAAVLLTAPDQAGLRVVMRRVDGEWKLENVITAAPPASGPGPAQ